MAQSVTRRCKFCGADVVSRYGSQQYCGPRCKYEAYVVKQDGCWGWNGVLHNTGYGKFTLPDGTYIFAHRFAHEEFIGPIPDGMFVLHKCDNPTCTNPEHLYAGTCKDNSRDCWTRGRASPPPRYPGKKPLAELLAEKRVRGEEHHSSKLTEDNVITILLSGERGAVLARRFGVARSLVSAIRKRKVWKHLSV